MRNVPLVPGAMPRPRGAGRLWLQLAARPRGTGAQPAEPSLVMSRLEGGAPGARKSFAFLGVARIV